MISYIFLGPASVVCDSGVPFRREPVSLRSQFLCFHISRLKMAHTNTALLINDRGDEPWKKPNTFTWKNKVLFDKNERWSGK